MSNFKGQKVTLQVPIDSVYEKVSDLSNLGKVDTLSQVISQAGLTLEQLTAQELVLKHAAIGEIRFAIVESQAPTEVHWVGSAALANQFDLFLHLAPLDELTTEIYAEVAIDLPFFVRHMIEKPLKEGMDKVALMLSRINYDAQ